MEGPEDLEYHTIVEKSEIAEMPESQANSPRSPKPWNTKMRVKRQDSHIPPSYLLLRLYDSEGSRSKYRFCISLKWDG